MAKNNSPLDYGSWAHRDAERAKKLYAEGKDSWAHALGIDEHDADYAHHWHKDEAERGHTGNSKWADGAPTMWETGSQIIVQRLLTTAGAWVTSSSRLPPGHLVQEECAEEELS